MSMDPGMMQQMLAQGLSGASQASAPVGSAAQLVQKVMLMKALQGQQPPQPKPLPPISQANPLLQQTNPMMQQQPLPGAQNV